VKNANPVSRLALACLGLVFLASACSRDQATAAPAAVAASKTVADFFPIKVGDRVVRMQLAVRDAEMQRGLMERRDLGRDDGMIFVYERPRQLSFWMRNTPTPLDIGFFNAAGELQEIHPMYPFDESSVPSRSAEIQFALEMNQGWYRDQQVKPGAKLDLAALTAALKERGFDPRRFGLAGK
jgi:uncharacterized membrane protein (UPF0127 family)